MKMCDDLRAKFGALGTTGTTGHDTIKRLSDAGVDEVLTPGKQEIFNKEINQFVEVAIDTGMLAHVLWKQDTEASCRSIARYCIVDYGDFAEFMVRYHESCSGGRSDCPFCDMVVYTSDLVDTMLNEDPEVFVSLNANDVEGLKHVKRKLAEIDPQTHFLCCFTHRALGPLADGTIRVPWSSRGEWCKGK